MSSPVLERDLQELKDLEALAVSGDEAAARAFFLRVNAIAGDMTRWQWVIHGETKEYRQRVVRWLVRQSKFRQALRFALCGRGDVGMLGSDGESVRIRPMGCGARFCPRCSRRYGRRFLGRVSAHLSSATHGELTHIVLTQRVLPEETLGGARARFERAWKSFYGVLRRLGLRSALATYHVTPADVKGWHFHCHLLAEWGDGITGETVFKDLDDAWFAALRDGVTQRKELFVRRVCEAGPALRGLRGDCQMEFWSESRDPAEVVLQYMLRDILQGVEGWINRLTSDAQAESFAADLGSAKLHRLYGAWRQPCEDGEESEADAENPASPDSVGPVGAKLGAITWAAIGSMDSVLWGASNGEVEPLLLVRCLLARSNSKAVQAIRLTSLVRAIAA